MSTLRLFGLGAALVLLPAIALALDLDDPALGLPPGPHAVGYRVSVETDPGRSFGPRTDLSGSRLPRPLARTVQVHLWYPAVAAGAEPMRHRDYVVAAAAAFARGDSVDEAAALRAYAALPVRRGADPEALAEILERPMRARLDAAPLAGPFPLVVYAPSINADPYENAVLFEHLAGHGYVVASAPSVGLYEPEVSRDRGGAEAQLGDLRFLLARAWDEPFVDRGRVGALGYSWGGMTGLLLALSHAGIDAVCCLDGAAAMTDYRPVAESFGCWDPRGLRAPLLEIVLVDQERDAAFHEAALYAPRWLWRLPGIKHRDLAADMVARLRLATGDADAAHASATWSAVARRVKLFFDAHLKGDAAAREFLNEPDATAPDAAWTAREALPAPPTRAQFVEVIETRGVQAAADLFHALRARDRGLVPFDEERLLAYCFTWGPDRSEDLRVLLDMVLEANPMSVDAMFWKAQIALFGGDEDGAVMWLRRALAVDPEHVRAQRLLARLEQGK